MATLSNTNFDISFEQGSTASTTCSVTRENLSTLPIAQATPLDIVVGSRGTHHSGPGNERFNQIIDSFIPKYCKASSKADKGKVFMEIFKTVSSFGRFLCTDPKTGLFYELSDYSAKEKISHALRYRRKRLLNKKKRSNLPAESTSTSLGQLLASNRRFRFDATQSQYPFQPPQFGSISSRFQEQPQQVQNVAMAETVEIISEEDMTSVLGRPGEFNWSGLGLEEPFL